MCKTYLFKDREKWRVRVIDTVTKKKTNHIFGSRDEAEAAMVLLGRTYRRPVAGTFDLLTRPRTSAKTAAGVRRLRVPPVLQPLLWMLAKGKQPNDRLFGDVNRHWVLRSCRRLCQTAGVPVVPAHGLRGTHAKLAVEAGISGNIVAASLGHESFATTAGHYAGADAVADAAASRVANALD